MGRSISLRRSCFRQLILLLVVGLAACSGKYEVPPTDLSSLSCGQDKKMVDHILGDANNIAQLNGVTLSEYIYDRGRSGYIVQGRRGNAPVVLAPILFTIMAVEHENEKKDFRSSQKGNILFVYDKKFKVIYIGIIHDLIDESVEKLGEGATIRKYWSGVCKACFQKFLELYELAIHGDKISVDKIESMSLFRKNNSREDVSDCKFFE